MIEDKNHKIIEALVEEGLWVGPLCHFYQWDGDMLLDNYIHIT